MIIWHQLVTCFGKIYCWKVYSIVSIILFSIFFFCGEGNIYLLIFASFLTALPAGGAYINEVIITDIIDYDEFQTGKRNEATYTVFSSYIPKVVSIFAQAIPLSILSSNIYY
jgi:Na+/melibiose symporter-like transporter